LANRPKTQPISAPSEQDLAHEFGELTYKHQKSRRAAIAALARKYSQSARDVYAAIERAKKSGD